MIRQIIDSTLLSLILGINAPNIFNSPTNLPFISSILATFLVRPYFALYHRIPSSRYLSVETFVLVFCPYLLLRLYNALQTIFSLALYYYSFFATVRGNGKDLARECAWIEIVGDDWRIRFKSECAGYSDGINADGNISGHILRAILNSISDKIFKWPTTVVGWSWHIMFWFLTIDLIYLLSFYIYKRAGQGIRWFVSQIKSFLATITRDPRLDRVYWPILAIFIVWKLYEIVNYWLWSLVWLIKLPFEFFIDWIFGSSLRFVVSAYNIWLHSKFRNQVKGPGWLRFFLQVGQTIFAIVTDPFGWGARFFIIGPVWALKTSLYITDSLTDVIHIFLALIGCLLWLSGRETVRGLVLVLLFFIATHIIQRGAFLLLSTVAPHILEPHPAISPAIDNAVESLAHPLGHGASLLVPIIKPMTFFSAVVYIVLLQILDLPLPEMVKVLIKLNLVSWWIMHIFYSGYEKMAGKPEEKAGGVLNGTLPFTPVLQNFEDVQNEEEEPVTDDILDEKDEDIKHPAITRYITPIALLYTFAYFAVYFFFEEHNLPTVVRYSLEFNTYIWWMMYLTHKGQKRTPRWGPEAIHADGSRMPSNTDDPNLEHGRYTGPTVPEPSSVLVPFPAAESEDIADKSPGSPRALGPFPLTKPEDIDPTTDETQVWWGLRELPLFGEFFTGLKLLVKWDSNPSSKLAVNTSLSPSFERIAETRRPNSNTTPSWMSGQIVKEPVSPEKFQQQATPLPKQGPQSANPSPTTPKICRQTVGRATITSQALPQVNTNSPVRDTESAVSSPVTPKRSPTAGQLPRSTTPTSKFFQDPTSPVEDTRSAISSSVTPNRSPTAGQLARSATPTSKFFQEPISPVEDARRPTSSPAPNRSPTFSQSVQGPFGSDNPFTNPNSPAKDTRRPTSSPAPNRKPESAVGSFAEKPVKYIASREEAQSKLPARRVRRSFPVEGSVDAFEGPNPFLEPRNIQDDSAEGGSRRPRTIAEYDEMNNLNL